MRRRYYVTSMSIDPEHDKMLEELATAHNMSRSEYLRYTIGRDYMAHQIAREKKNG